MATNFTPIPSLGLLRWTMARALTSPVGTSRSNWMKVPGGGGSLVLRSGVNLAHFLQKWPKIQHSSPKCLQQSMTFQKSSFSCPAILTYESDGVSHLPAFG